MSTYNPSVTFNRFTKDGVEVTLPTPVTISSAILSGVDVDKHIYSFVITPAEPTTVTPAEYEIIFDVTPNDGDERVFWMPLSHGGAESHGNDERFPNLSGGSPIETTWDVGVLSGVGTIDLGHTGAKLVFSGVDFPNSGSTSWEAEMIGASGSNVMDVPTIYYGSFIALNDPQGAWDNASPLHDFEIVKPHVGHNVRITDIAGTYLSGTFQDDVIDIFGSNSTGVMINIKTYHEYTDQWELYSGTESIQSGTFTFVSDTWLFTEDIQIGQLGLDETFELRLYASGTEVAIQHPTPLRTIEINIYILEGAGRFGIGRFGLARFGLESDQ